MKEIIVYTNEKCPYCKQIVEELDKNNIKHSVRLTNDWGDEWQDVVNLTGIPTVPTVQYKDNYFISGRDFNSPQQIINILNNFKKCSFPIDQQTFEKVKTLNYNINTAFGRLDQLLRQIENKLNKEE